MRSNLQTSFSDIVTKAAKSFAAETGKEIGGAAEKQRVKDLCHVVEMLLGVGQFFLTVCRQVCEHTGPAPERKAYLAHQVRLWDKKPDGHAKRGHVDKGSCKEARVIFEAWILRPLPLVNCTCCWPDRQLGEAGISLPSSGERTTVKNGDGSEYDMFVIQKEKSS